MSDGDGSRVGARGERGGDAGKSVDRRGEERSDGEEREKQDAQ